MSEPKPTQAPKFEDLSTLKTIMTKLAALDDDARQRVIGYIVDWNTSHYTTSAPLAQQLNGSARRPSEGFAGETGNTAAAPAQ